MAVPESRDVTSPGLDPSGAVEAPDESLERGLTGPQIAMIGLSGALGTGLFLGSGSMIAVAGPGIILSYTLTGILALIIVWALAEMTTKHPVPGGYGAVAHAYLGPLGGFLARWNYGVTMCIAVGAEVTASAGYLTFWWKDISLPAATIGCSLLIVLINVATVKFYGASEYWFSMIKVAMVVIFIALGFVIAFFGLPSQPATGLTNLTSDGGFLPMGVSGVLIAAVMAVFSFGGAESVSITAAESQNPTRDIPRAALAMIVRLILFYVLAIAVVVTVEKWTVSAAGDGTVQSSPFVAVLSAAGVGSAAGIMNAVLIVAALSAGNGQLYASARMFHSLAIDKMAPRVLGRTTKGSPRAAVLASTAGMVVASALAIYRPKDAFMLLFGVLVFGLWINWVIIVATHFRFRSVRAQLGLEPSPARLWGAPVTTGIAAVALVAIGVSLFFIEGLSIAWRAGAPFLALMLLGYAVAARRGVVRESVLTQELAERERNQLAADQG